MKKIPILICFLIVTKLAVAQAPEDSLREYIGIYKFPPGSEMVSLEITVVNGGLFGSTNMGSGSLVRVNKDTFSIPEHNGIAYFSRNAEKKVVRIHLEVGELILDGEKENSSLAMNRIQYEMMREKSYIKLLTEFSLYQLTIFC